jgi:two-component system sensor kinase FixL
LEKRPSRAKPDDLNVILQEAVALTFLGATGAGVLVRQQITSVAIPVIVDRIQIQQVLHNLMRNAVEAMQNTPARELILSTGVDDDDFGYFEIRDSGPGISEAGLASLFEPLKTSKMDGMREGLSICRTIIDAHKGAIQVTGNQPSGACFHVQVPLARAAEIQIAS